jgi:hypothetical protein
MMASSKGGHLLFHPQQIDLPSIPALVAFYHACLRFLVKDMWLNAIKEGNCGTFAGLSYLNVACYCPNSDETILRHLVQMQQNVQSTRPQSTPCPSPPPIIESPTPLAKALQEVFLSTQSANSILMTWDASPYGHAQATNMSGLHTIQTGT